ncbi:BTB/POZ domain-containing protein [Tanacetum coccineum]
MLHEPWKDATSPVLTLHVHDNNVNREAIALALAYLYENHPKLDDSNAFRVLAAASFLDLQEYTLDNALQSSISCSFLIGCHHDSAMLLIQM